jgi:hypothetical protein
MKEPNRTADLLVRIPFAHREVRGPTFHPQRANTRRVVVLAGWDLGARVPGEARGPCESPPRLEEVPPGAGADPRRVSRTAPEAPSSGEDGEAYRIIFRRSQEEWG